jgi:uncharacterized phage protein (TIGR02218 family)
MKNVSAGFKTMLATSARLMVADLITITLRSGTVLRYCNAPQSIVVGTTTWQHAAHGNGVPGFKRGPIKLSIGLAVESITVDLLYDATSRVNNVTPGAFAAAGGFDGATIVIDRLLTPDLNDTSRGVVNLFKGLISEASIDSERVTLNCASDLVFLHAAFPPRLFQPPCNNALFDARCGLDKAAYAVNATADAGSTTSTIAAAELTQATNYFAQGYVVITSGANAGLIRAVKSSASGSLTLVYPLPVACAVNDAFTAYPGCAKTEAACKAFGNHARFGGFPYLPYPEVVQLGSNGQAPTDSAPGAGIGDIRRGGGGVNSTYKLK